MALLAMLGLMVSGCSRYDMVYREPFYNEAGAFAGMSETRITNSVPPGGRDASLGNIDIGAGSESWRIQMGQQGAVDATGTAAFLQGLVNALVTQSAENGQRVLELQSMQTLIAQYEATLKNMQAQLNELRARSAPVPPVEIPR
jgi:hypothetical protein